MAKGDLMNTLSGIAEDFATGFLKQMEKQYRKQLNLDQDKGLHDILQKQVKESYEAGYTEGYAKGQLICSQKGNNIDVILPIFLVFVLALCLMFVWKNFIQKKNDNDTSSEEQSALSNKVYGELQDIKKELKTIKGPSRIKRAPREASSSLSKKKSTNIQKPTSQQTNVFKMD